MATTPFPTSFNPCFNGFMDKDRELPEDRLVDPAFQPLF